MGFIEVDKDEDFERALDITQTKDYVEGRLRFPNYVSEEHLMHFRNRHYIPRVMHRDYFDGGDDTKFLEYLKENSQSQWETTLYEGIATIHKPPANADYSGQLPYYHFFVMTKKELKHFFEYKTIEQRGDYSPMNFWFNPTAAVCMYYHMVTDFRDKMKAVLEADDTKQKVYLLGVRFDAAYYAKQYEVENYFTFNRLYQHYSTCTPVLSTSAGARSLTAWSAS